MTGSKLILLFASTLCASFAYGNSNTEEDYPQLHPSEHTERQFFGWGSCEELEEILERELISLGCKTQVPHPHAIEPARCNCPSVKSDLNI